MDTVAAEKLRSVTIVRRCGADSDARGGIRTHTPRRTVALKATVAASFTTRAERKPYRADVWRKASRAGLTHIIAKTGMMSLVTTHGRACCSARFQIDTVSGALLASRPDSRLGTPPDPRGRRRVARSRTCGTQV